MLLHDVTQEAGVSVSPTGSESCAGQPEELATIHQQLCQIPFLSYINVAATASFICRMTSLIGKTSCVTENTKVCVSALRCMASTEPVISTICARP